MKYFIGKGRLMRWIEVLVVWIVLGRIFGMMSHMAWFGVALMVQLLCYQLYERQKEVEPDAIKKRFTFAAAIGAVALGAIVNAFWAEYDAWWFKLFMVLFWGFCFYGAVRIYRETGKRQAAIGVSTKSSL
ncbi:hypothetical protein [Paenibacillus campi]|uniref:hypothetical protein n=1 Tax=Paenibacillus campi TaxID=3106031 RepID=UPI002B00201C|nr:MULTISPECIES: hypothetical protein [unclassified Paenibacillus]